MKQNNEEIEKYRATRFSDKSFGNNGIFSITIENRIFYVIASDQGGWDHVSVSTQNRCPNWFEMKLIKELFFDDEETVVQFHPKKSEYINNHEFCLHMCRDQGNEHRLPPKEYVGMSFNK